MKTSGDPGIGCSIKSLKRLQLPLSSPPREEVKAHY